MCPRETVELPLVTWTQHVQDAQERLRQALRGVSLELHREDCVRPVVPAAQVVDCSGQRFTPGAPQHERQALALPGQRLLYEQLQSCFGIHGL